MSRRRLEGWRSLSVIAGTTMALMATALVAGALATSPEPIPETSAASPPGGSGTQQKAIREEPDNAPKEDGQAYARLKQSRISRGQRPVDDQVDEQARQSGRSREDTRQTNVAVITLRTPMPLNVARRYRNEHKWFGDGSNAVSLYIELDDGYPFNVQANSLEGGLHNLQAFMLHMADMADSKDYAPIGPNHSYQSDGDFATQARRGAADLEH